MVHLPDDYQLRPAQAEDLPEIRRLVLSEWLDPTQLQWQQFWVIVTRPTGESFTPALIACGQLRSFEGAQELGSVVVRKDLRGKGLGSDLIQHLIAQATQPLYLECLGKGRTRFYERFGFVPVRWGALPRSLRFKFGPSAIASQVLRLPITLMHYSPLTPGS